MSARQPSHICPTCNRVFSRQWNLHRHEQTHAQAQLAIYPCRIAGCHNPPFMRSDVRQRHERHCASRIPSLLFVLEPSSADAGLIHKNQVRSPPPALRQHLEQLRPSLGQDHVQRQQDSYLVDDYVLVLSALQTNFPSWGVQVLPWRAFYANGQLVDGVLGGIDYCFLPGMEQHPLQTYGIAPGNISAFINNIQQSMAPRPGFVPTVWPSADQFEIVGNKARLLNLLATHHVPVIRTFPAENLDELRHALEEDAIQVCVKLPRFSIIAMQWVTTPQKSA